MASQEKTKEVLYHETSRNQRNNTVFNLSAVLIWGVAIILFSLTSLRVIFSPFQFFLMGLLTGALLMALLVLFLDKDFWPQPQLYSLLFWAGILTVVTLNFMLMKILF